MSQKSKSSNLPKGWPSEIQYLSTQNYSPSLTPNHLSALRRPSSHPPTLSPTAKGPFPLVKITPITIPSHPACGQCGLFVTRDLKPGSFILPYLGEVHADARDDSDYDLSLDRELGIGIDAANSGNEARFINDYRGVDERANAEFKEGWDEVQGCRVMGVWVLGGKGREKGIRKGHEILVSYGRGFWGARKNDEGD